VTQSLTHSLMLSVSPCVTHTHRRMADSVTEQLSDRLTRARLTQLIDSVTSTSSSSHSVSELSE